MITYHDIESLVKKTGDKPIFFTIGNFDGVHLGHRFILKNFLKFCHQRGYEPVVLTFSPHPNIYFNQSSNYLLNSIEDKKNYMKKLGIPNMLIMEFSSELSKMQGHQFIQWLTRKIHTIKGFYLGHDFSLGANKSFTIKEMVGSFSKDYEIFEEEQFKVEDKEISSTLIRRLLLNGYVKEANRYLNRPYKILGKVVPGNKVGRTLGFPTLNIDFDTSHLLPKAGVYFGRVSFNGHSFAAAVNIGTRPSVTDDQKITLEAHLLNFNADIYGVDVSLEFLEFIRDEKLFLSKEKLRTQIQADVNSMQGKSFELKMGLIGKNIQHSLSEQTYLNLLEGKAISYKLFDFASESEIPDLKKILTDFPYLSVTAPYKQFCFEKCFSTNLDDLQAVNVLKVEKDKIVGINTDYEACDELLQSYVEEGYDIFVLLGDGAMARIFTKLFEIKKVAYFQLSRKLKNLQTLEVLLKQQQNSGNVMVINSCSREYKIPAMNVVNYTVWDLNYSMLEHQMLFHNKKVRYIDGEELLNRQAKKALSFWNLKNT